MERDRRVLFITVPRVMLFEIRYIIIFPYSHYHLISEIVTRSVVDIGH